ncbi:glycosyl transferase [Trichothermofontia sp.]
MVKARPTLYVAITHHGFGHVTRTASVVAAIQARCPEILPILVTTAPRWLLESYLGEHFIHRPWSFDVGVVQADSLNMDKAATLAKWADIRARATAIVAAEVGFINQNRVGLVLADIPPLAATIARRAGVPGWMLSNFGWDFIYRDWGGEFTAIADWISGCYQQCDHLFRLPFHEPMTAFPRITDVGLTGGTPRYDRDFLRALLELTAPPERTVLLTFGGLGLQQIPYVGLAAFPDWQFLTFDTQAPDLPNLIAVRGPMIQARAGDFDLKRLRPVDLMPLCGRVVSKPGFSTFSEACRLSIPIVTLTRDDFAEAAILINGIRDYAYHQVLTPDEFNQGKWAFLYEPPCPPRQGPEAIAKDGTEAIAQAVVDALMA